MKKQRRFHPFFKKSLVASVVAVALAFASCSPDDNKTDLGPEMPITGLEVPASSTDKPIIEGAEVTVKGEGFNATSEIWAIPGAEGKSVGPSGIKTFLLGYTKTGISFRAPAWTGTCYLVLKQDGNSFRLGTMTFIMKKDGIPVKNIVMPESSSDDPFAEGSAITIQGEGFTAESQIWLSPAAGDGEPVQAEVSGFDAKGLTIAVPSLSGEYVVLLKMAGAEFEIGSMFVEKRGEPTDLVGQWNTVQDSWVLNKDTLGYAYPLENGDFQYDENDNVVKIPLMDYCNDFAEAYNKAHPDQQITFEDILANYYGDGSYTRFGFQSSTVTLFYGFVTPAGSVNTEYFTDAPYTYDPETGAMVITDNWDIPCRVEKFTESKLVFTIKNYYPFPVRNYDKTQEYYVYATVRYMCQKMK